MIDHKKLRKLLEETLKGDTCVLGKQLCRTVYSTLYRGGGQWLSVL